MGFEVSAKVSIRSFVKIQHEVMTLIKVVDFDKTV